MNFDKQYRNWQIICIEDCNKKYSTDFNIKDMDKKFEVCEDGKIHIYGGVWYEGLVPFE